MLLESFMTYEWRFFFSNFTTNDFSSPILFSIALLITALGCVFSTLFTARSTAKSPDVCSCCRGSSVGNGETTAYLKVGSRNSVGAELSKEMVEKVAAVQAAEKQTSGASMMEQLVPEITTHALSYLDYPSLCRLSMTNSLMRKAANDDNAWKALYHKL